MIADLYDFDKTLFPADSAAKYWLFCIKRHPVILKYLPKQAAGAIKFLKKKITLKQLKESFFCFLESIDGEKEAEEFWKKNEHKIFDWVNLKDEDVASVVCSASPEFEIRPVLKKLGADVIIGTNMDPKTGKISGENCKGKEKVRRIEELQLDYHYRNAYSDNPESDAPMLNLAENKFLIDKGKIVKL